MRRPVDWKRLRGLARKWQNDGKFPEADYQQYAADQRAAELPELPEGFTPWAEVDSMLSPELEPAAGGGRPPR
jgi:hypothetical protein